MPDIRKQCAKCPWKKGVNPRDIPNEYCETKHADLKKTIAKPGVFTSGSLRMMACHETPVGNELPCVGWMIHQLGPGNNLPFRLAVMQGKFDINVATVGPQHERFEDTLPKPITKTRYLAGYRAKSIDRDGQVLEYSDPFPTRRAAVRSFWRKRGWLSSGMDRLVTVAVYRWRVSN